MLLRKTHLFPTLLILAVAACTGAPSTEPSSNQPDPVKPVDPKLLSPDEQLFREDFSKVLTQSIDLSHEGLAELYPAESTPISQLSYDPLAAGFMPEIIEAYHLNPAEQSRLAENGFMVSERLGFNSMAWAFEDVFQKDLPVLITSDSVLHALHRSFNEILKTTEEQVLIPTLSHFLGDTHAGLGDLSIEGDLSDASRDVDLFLTVARSLLEGTQVDSLAGGTTDSQVTEILTAVAELRMLDVKIFGATRKMDFSQFKPRGHYEDTVPLQQYFRAMIWLGRVDFRLREYDPANGQLVWRDRQIQGSYLLHRAVEQAKTFARWKQMSDLIGLLIGEPDAMDLDAYQSFIAEAEINDDSDMQGDLALIHKTLEAGRYGTQRINSHYLATNPLSTETTPLPLSFALMGQRFVVDSFTFSNVVYENIEFEGQKMFRALPNPLDAMFVLGANHALPLLEEELETWKYAGNLHALRFLTDAYEPEFWEQNTYNLWLSAIRALNTPTEAEPYPEAMQTEAWDHKTLHTQLASWAQLRHDTILYVKQSYTGGVSCEYPDGYVEPYPELYAQIGALARNLGIVLADQPFTQEYTGLMVKDWLETTSTIMGHLESMATKELADEPFNAEEQDLIAKWIKQEGICGGPSFTGWYPQLFFNPMHAEEFDPTIADVHTNPSESGPLAPARVLHVGTGPVQLMVFTRNTCEGSKSYVGPVLSYYEHIEVGLNRLTDSDWSDKLLSDTPPARPAWTQSFLVANP